MKDPEDNREEIENEELHYSKLAEKEVDYDFKRGMGKEYDRKRI